MTLSDIIKNENLKLFQINYLARKVDFFFNFPSASQCTCNRAYGKTMYTECPRRNGQNFGRVFLMLNYTDITQNTYIQS